MARRNFEQDVVADAIGLRDEDGLGRSGPDGHFGRSYWASSAVAVDHDVLFFASFDIELTPVIASVTSDQPSPPATLACRAGNTVQRTCMPPT